MRAAVAAVTAALALGACAGASVQAPEPARAVIAPDGPAEAQLVQRVEWLADRVAGTSCVDFAREVDDWITNNDDDIRELSRQTREAPGVPPQELRQLEERLAGAFTVVVRRFKPCMDHARAKRSFGHLQSIVAGA